MSADLAPNRIGSLNFCPVCGTLLDVPGDDDYVTCEQCGHTENAARASTLSALDCFSANASNVFPAEYENVPIITRSHPEAFPSPLKDKRSLVQSVQKAVAEETNKQQEIRETCPKCGK